MLFQKMQSFGEKCPNLRLVLALEELRRSGEQNLHYPDTILPSAATRGADLPLGLGPVPLGWLNQMEVVLAAGKVNVGITGVFFFPALVMGLDIRDLGAFVLGEAHDGVVRLCQGQPSLFEAFSR